MKSFKDYLREAEQAAAADEPPKKKKTKVKDRPNTSAFDRAFAGPSQDNPLSQRAPDQDRQQRSEPDAPRDPRSNQSSRSNTSNRTSGLSTPGMAAKLAGMRDIAPHPDDVPANPEEPTMDITQRVEPDNLPSVAGQALQAAGVVNPEWHKVANLPGNMKRAIQSLGRHLFGSMTRTRTEDIQMIANLGGQGPNTTQEVRAVAAWIRDNGDDLGPGDIDFATSIPGYNAEIHNYVAAGIHWLLVRDEFGQYIYSWPEQDSIGHQGQERLGRPEQRRLGR
jgi:hypothetical protein